MTTPLLIGITGAARSGKSTIAEHLRDKHGFTVLAMADPLKEMLFVLDPIIGVDEDADVQGTGFTMTPYPVYLSDFIAADFDWVEGMDEDQLKRLYPEYRRLLQTLGTECIRARDEDYWVRDMSTRVERALDRGENVVIPDIRFPNEANALSWYWGGEATTRLVRVDRPGLDAGAHRSERYAGKLGATTTFLNDGPLSSLLTSVDDYLEGLTR